MASGLSYTGCWMTEIARRHGITRAAASNRCGALTDEIECTIGDPNQAQLPPVLKVRARKVFRDAKPPGRLESRFELLWRAVVAHLPSRTLIEMEGGIYVTKSRPLALAHNKACPSRCPRVTGFVFE